MDIMKLRVSQVKNLLTLAEERNLPVPFTTADIDEVVSESTSDVEKLRNLGRLSSILHEIVYAPPNRG